jgi:thiol-disulfide isomerase/thioredoxin
MSEVVAYKFWSPTCEPCLLIAPSLNTLKDDFESVEWQSVNVKEQPGLAAKFDVTRVPTMVVTRGGTVVGRVTGTAMAEYYRILRRATTS